MLSFKKLNIKYLSGATCRDFQDVEDAEFLIFYLIEAINQATIRLVRIFPERVVYYFFLFIVKISFGRKTQTNKNKILWKKILS